MFLPGCSDHGHHQDQLFCLFELKNPPWPCEQSLGQKRLLSMGINCMLLAVWLGEDRKCSAAVVGLDLVLGLSMIRRCSSNWSFRLSYVVVIDEFTVSK